MPRAPIGTLLPPGANGLWRGRVTKNHDDGTTSRPIYSLGTTDKARARRELTKLAKTVAEGGEVGEGMPAKSESVAVYAEAWLAKRAAQGVATVQDERGWLRRDVLDAIGKVPIGDVRPSHIRGVLDESLARGLRRNSLANIRGVMSRLFRAAVEDELIVQSPVTAVGLPRMREVRKARTILTDKEESSRCLLEHRSS